MINQAFMRKPVRFLVAASLLLIHSAAFPCLNEYSARQNAPMQDHRLNLNYLLEPSDTYHPYWLHGFQNQGLLDRQNQYLKMGIRNLNFRDLSDFAVIELKLGDKEKGLTILEELYRKRPTEYNIVANLGTAYELNGDLPKALEYLKKAVALNPGSHYGSEWIHIKILEQQLADSPDYKKIINLGITDFQKWLTDKTYQFPRPADSLKLQIASQLNERIAFIAPPDPVIGQLVTDFADIVAKTDSIGAAKTFYRYALTYDGHLKDSIAKRISGIEASEKEVKDTFRWASVVWAVPLLALVMIFLAWLKSLRQRKPTK